MGALNGLRAGVVRLAPQNLGHLFANARQGICSLTENSGRGDRERDNSSANSHPHSLLHRSTLLASSECQLKSSSMTMDPSAWRATSRSSTHKASPLD